MQGKNKLLTGEVVSVDDPTCSGRIKVRIKGYNDNLSVDELPWVTFGGSGMFSGDGGGSLSIPRVGAKVRLQSKNDGDGNAFEWVGTNRIDRKLAEEIAGDYEGTHVLLYDSDSDLSIIYQNQTGLRFYYKGSFIQLSPDNTITMHYGEGNQGVQIQLSDGKVDIQGAEQINISAGNAIKLEADSIVLNGKQNVQIKGNKPGEIAVNGRVLYQTLMIIASMIDEKVPQTGGIVKNIVKSTFSTMVNDQIQYI